MDEWYFESDWNIWSIDQQYVFTKNETFNIKNQITIKTIDLQKGHYKLCVTDTYGDGGVNLTVKDQEKILVSGTTSGKIVRIYI